MTKELFESCKHKMPMQLKTYIENEMTEDDAKSLICNLNNINRIPTNIVEALQEFRKSPRYHSKYFNMMVHVTVRNVIDIVPFVKMFDYCSDCFDFNRYICYLGIVAAISLDYSVEETQNMLALLWAENLRIKSYADAKNKIGKIFNKTKYYGRIIECAEVSKAMGIDLDRINENADVAEKFIIFNQFNAKKADEYFNYYQRSEDSVYEIESELTDEELETLSTLNISATIANKHAIKTDIHNSFVSVSYSNNCEVIAIGKGTKARVNTALTNGLHTVTIIIQGRRHFVYESEQNNKPKNRRPVVTLFDIVYQSFLSEYAKNFWLKYFDHEAEENPFAKDLKQLFVTLVQRLSIYHKRPGIYKNDIDAFSISLERALNCHNWNEYFHTYAIADHLKLNFNKLSPEIAYAAVNAARAIEPEDLNMFSDFVIKYDKLYRVQHEMFADEPLFKFEINRVQLKILVDYFMYRIKKHDPLSNISQYTIEDFLKMSVMQHKKISLKTKSYTKLTELHDELARANDIYKMKPVKVRKDSVFNELRNILPDTFEWLTNKKRLYQETTEQSNCVWTYADKITNDKCAIYSYVNPATGSRHTIEFNFDPVSKTYRAIQILKRFNKRADIEVIQELNKYIHAEGLGTYADRLNPNHENANDNVFQLPFGNDDDDNDVMLAF